MKKRLLSVILVLAMLLSSVAILASCNDEENPTETETQDSTESGTKPSATETETESTSASETASATDSASASASESETQTEAPTETNGQLDSNYENGAEVKDAGIVWEDEAFALTNNTIDESKAVTKTAAEMLALLVDKEAMKAGEVYKVTEPLVLSSNTKYYGNLAAVIAQGGIVIENVEEIVIKELVVKGSITVKGASGITFFKLDLQDVENGVSIDATSYDVAFKSCKLNVTGTAISSEAELLSVYQSYIVADKGIVSSGDEFAVQSTQIDAKTLGVSSSGSYCTVKGNTITAAKDGNGVILSEGSSNGLVALNIIKDAQTSVSIKNGFNCVVLLNSAITVEGIDNTNLYVVENSLGGAIVLENNEYLLCDANTFPKKDGKNHPVVKTNNTQFNGNNMHDVDARLEHGANEELVPHTNRELFVGMERRGQIRDISLTKKSSFNNYIRSMARQGSIVIVPPGAYSVTSVLSLDAAHSNTTLYAYGVLEEKDSVPEGETRPSGSIYDSMGTLMNVIGNNINVYGITWGYDFQSSGQAYILQKWVEEDPVTKNEMTYIRIVANAGFVNGFLGTDPEIFGSGNGIQVAKGNMYYSFINGLSHKFIQQDPDGTIVLQITHKRELFDMLQPGDVLGCRLEGDNNRTLGLLGSNTLVKDCVLYGYSSALAIVSSGANATNVRLERLHNTSKPAPIIDKETYDRYIALEEQYGMTNEGGDHFKEGTQGLEIYIDEQGRYRGGLPRWGSVDGTHITGAAQGTSATSCIFEHMVDDASNQRASSGRIAGIHNNGDGTTTLYIKGSLAQVYFNINQNKGAESAGPTNCPALREGDTVFAYNSDGKVLIEGTVLSTQKGAGELPSDCHMVHIDADNDCVCDTCKALMHYDYVKNDDITNYYPDCKCDKCGVTVHRNYNSGVTYNGKSDDKCDANVALCPLEGDLLVDADGDGLNDADGAYIIRDMAAAGQTSYNPVNSQLSYKMVASQAGRRYIVTYNTSVNAITVNTSDVNFDALEGFDFTDNDYFMEEKIICDNISLNSANFTFDNVLMQEYHSRGILMKTRDSNVKHCTFRNVAITGMLLSIETTWGESSVPKNINIENSLFDNTGHTYDQFTNKTYSPIALRGLGDLANPGKVIAEDNLPCENINIIGNKFINTNNIYVMTLYDSKNVTIKNNIIECRSLRKDNISYEDRLLDENGNKVIDEELGRAFYFERCINVEISDNTYICGEEMFKNGTFIVGFDYKNLTGTDLYDAEGNRFPSIPENKEDKPFA